MWISASNSLYVFQKAKCSKFSVYYNYEGIEKDAQETVRNCKRVGGRDVKEERKEMSTRPK